MKRKLLFALVVLFPATAAAHRLDEYLQATRISVELRRVIVEINLTPGAAVADDVFSAIDRDRDGRISDAEGLAYAELVVRSLSLDVDGERRQLTLDSCGIPSLADMRLGEGVIRLHATATMSPASAGPHRLKLVNTHRPDISVYLVNALVPSDPRIHITGQSRDMLQRDYEMQFTTSRGEDGVALAAVWPPLLAIAIAAMGWIMTRRAFFGKGEMFIVQRSIVVCHRRLCFAHLFLKDAAPKAHPKMTNDN